MYSKKTLWSIWELELFLFGGVPETAEQMYERDFHSLSEARKTKEPIRPTISYPDSEEDELVCRLEYDIETRKYKIIEDE